MTDYFQVGAIIRTHGVKGEVKVFPTTDDVNRFKKLKEVILEPEAENITLKIQSVRFQKNLVIIKFKGIDDINDVEKYVKKNIYVTRENAVKCEEDEFFIADLIGLQAVDENGDNIGTLVDVITTGANDVYVLKNDDKEILVPAIKECILDVSIEEQKITIHLMKGLVD